MAVTLTNKIKREDLQKMVREVRVEVRGRRSEVGRWSFALRKVTGTGNKYVNSFQLPTCKSIHVVPYGIFTQYTCTPLWSCVHVNNFEASPTMYVREVYMTCVHRTRAQ